MVSEYDIKQKQIEDIYRFKAKKTHNLRIEYALKAIQHCTNILEVGCGSGFCLRSLVHYLNNVNAKAVGFDNDKNEIAEAKFLWNADNRITYNIADAEEEFTFNDGEFDAVLVLDVLEHVRDIDNVLKESNRVLKKKGVFFVGVPCEAEEQTLHSKLKRKGWQKSCDYAGHITALTQREVIKKLEETGFCVEWMYYSCHYIGQITDVCGYEIKHYADKKQQKGLTLSEKIKFYLLKKSMKTFLLKLSYYESKILARSGKKALDLNICCYKK